MDYATQHVGNSRSVASALHQKIRIFMESMAMNAFNVNWPLKARTAGRPNMFGEVLKDHTAFLATLQDLKLPLCLKKAFFGSSRYVADRYRAGMLRSSVNVNI